MLLAGTASCGPAFVSFSAPCTLAAPTRFLPSEITESSGLVASRSRPGAFWTHNDGPGDEPLYLIDAGGGLLDSVPLVGASVQDWEDLAIGGCGPNGETSCLYLADTGDNDERRDDPTLYRVPEPPPGASETAPLQRFTVRFPDGPRDVEALYLLPGERLFLVTKGRNQPVELYRVPALPTLAAAPPDVPLMLEHVQTLTSEAPPLPQWVTGASATPDGRFIAIRTYATLQFYRPGPGGTVIPLAGGLVNLSVVGEVQGEAVAFASGTDVVLTSEAGPLGGRGTLATLRCTPEEGR